MRWLEETKKAANYLGWNVVETDGVDDWHGWGVLLLKTPTGDWGVLTWSYGSAGCCDQYEDAVRNAETPAEYAAIFCDCIEPCPDEEAARMKFSERKGW